MSKLLVITSNSEPDSMTNASAAALAQGAAKHGAETDIMDLYEIGFNPVYTLEDREYYLGRAPMPEDLIPLQERLVRADAITFVFPMYWFSMPAMVEGFFDRVLCRNFAYSADDTPGALAGKKARLVIIMDGTEASIKASGVEQGLHAQFYRETFNRYFGIDDIDLVYMEGLMMGDDSLLARQSASLQLESLARLGASLI